MRSSAVLVGAVLFALATASPHPENPAQGEHGLLVSRADDLSPELAQVVANNGATSGCFSSISTPAVPAKLRKRQALDLSQESCPNIDTTICRQGFTPLCCDPDLYYDPSTSNHLPGTIESGCTPITVGGEACTGVTWCCLRWIRNILEARDPTYYKGWGMFCYNPFE